MKKEGNVASQCNKCAWYLVRRGAGHRGSTADLQYHIVLKLNVKYICLDEGMHSICLEIYKQTKCIDCSLLLYWG